MYVLEHAPVTSFSCFFECLNSIVFLTLSHGNVNECSIGNGLSILSSNQFDFWSWINTWEKKEVALEPPHQQDSLKFIPESNWAAVKGLDSIKVFEHLISNMESEALQWRKWYGEQEPEIVDLPRAMKDISLFHRILLLRALRPDRLTNALTEFIRQNMGADYVEQ